MKRLSKQEKMNQFMIDIINKMFYIAGHSVTYDDIKDRKDDWFTEWTMTVAQSDEWQKWGVEEIMKRFKLKRPIAEREMGMIALNYGLKFSDFDTTIKKI